jgi:hypothetical protein
VGEPPRRFPHPGQTSQGPEHCQGSRLSPQARSFPGDGPVLSRDAGFVTFNDTFDATTGDFLGETFSPENRPHPDLDSGFTLFCDVIVAALS